MSGWSDPREARDQYGNYYKPREVVDPCPCGYPKHECAELKEKRRAGNWCRDPNYEPK